MTFRFSPHTCLGIVTRSFLLSLGFDHLFIDFLERMAIGAAAVFLAIIFVGVRTRRRQ